MEMCSIKLSVTNSPSPPFRPSSLTLSVSLFSPSLYRYFLALSPLSLFCFIESVSSFSASFPFNSYFSLNLFLLPLRAVQCISLGDDVCDAAHCHSHRRLPL